MNFNKFLINIFLFNAIIDAPAQDQEDLDQEGLLERSHRFAQQNVDPHMSLMFELALLIKGITEKHMEALRIPGLQSAKEHQGEERIIYNLLGADLDHHINEL